MSFKIRHKKRCSPYKQSGFLLPLLIVIMVAASGIALLLLDSVNKNSLSVYASSFASQSNYAAQVGAELSSHALFFSSATPFATRRERDSQCLNTVNRRLTVTGLNDCTINIVCECRYENNSLCDTTNNNNYNGVFDLNRSFYQIVSEASCGQGFTESVSRYSIVKKSP